MALFISQLLSYLHQPDNTQPYIIVLSRGQTTKIRSAQNPGQANKLHVILMKNKFLNDQGIIKLQYKKYPPPPPPPKKTHNTSKYTFQLHSITF